MANTIKIGNIEASAIKIGTSTVSAVYIGSTKIYPSGTPTPPTDNWVLVDNEFTSPRKIKVDYSLIGEDNSNVRDDYELSFPEEPYIVLYLNEPTIEYFSEEFGWDQDKMLENYLGMVAVINVSGELLEILEDGVEYSEIGGRSITEMDYLFLSSGAAAADNPYLYATE